MSKAQEIYEAMTAEQREDVGPGAWVPDWVHEQFPELVDADADYDGEHYVDCSTWNELGREVVELIEEALYGEPEIERQRR